MDTNTDSNNVIKIINGCLLVLLGLCCICIYTQDKEVEYYKQINKEHIESIQELNDRCLRIQDLYIETKKLLDAEKN